MNHNSEGKKFLPYKHAAGGAWLSTVPGHNQQVFNHWDTEDLIHRHYDVAAMKRLISTAASGTFEMINVVLEAKNINFVMNHAGIEHAYLERMTKAHLEIPGIMVLLQNGDCVVVDGNHRYVRRHQLNMGEMKFVRMTEEQAKITLLDISPVPPSVAYAGLS
jgi:hypothetical protein